jgi:hypothetical protein
MAISHYFTKALVIRRLSAVGATDKEAMIATGTIGGYLAQISDTPVSAGEYGVGDVTHKAWVDINSNVKIGDKLVDRSDGKEYDVVGINEKGRGVAMNEHLAIFLSKKVKGNE